MRKIVYYMSSTKKNKRRKVILLDFFPSSFSNFFCKCYTCTKVIQTAFYHLAPFLNASEIYLIVQLTESRCKFLLLCVSKLAMPTCGVVANC